MNLEMGSLKNIDFKDPITRYWSVVAAIWGFGIILLIAFGVLLFNIINTRQAIADANGQLETTRQEVSYFFLNRQIPPETVEEYNTILTQLIPETEDYFSIIASLEQLTIRTGLKISRYSIELPKDNSSKFTLNIVGTVPIQDRNRFLNSYKFGTGRYVAIQNIELNSQVENNVRISINFYSKKVTISNLSKVGSLEQVDLDLMEDIKKNIEDAKNAVSDPLPTATPTPTVPVTPTLRVTPSPALRTVTITPTPPSPTALPSAGAPTTAVPTP